MVQGRVMRVGLQRMGASWMVWLLNTEYVLFKYHRSGTSESYSEKCQGLLPNPSITIQSFEDTCVVSLRSRILASIHFWVWALNWDVSSSQLMNIPRAFLMVKPLTRYPKHSCRPLWNGVLLVGSTEHPRTAILEACERPYNLCRGSLPYSY